jgi:hypothetical protein
LFSWGPFNHTGARLDFDSGNGFGAKLAVMNPTDIVEFNPVNTYTLGAQLGYSGDAGGVYLNFLLGDQDGKLDEDESSAGDTSAGTLFQADVTLGYDLSEKFYLGFNASLQSVGDGETFDGTTISDVGGDPSSFLGFAVYPKLSLTENFALGLRAEYFAVKNYHLGIFGLDTNGDGNVIDVTLSGNLKAGRLTFIPELRIDMTSEDSFFKPGATSTTNVLPSLNFAAVYSF